LLHKDLDPDNISGDPELTSLSAYLDATSPFAAIDSAFRKALRNKLEDILVKLSAYEATEEASIEANYKPTPIKVFYSYAHEDKSLRDELEMHIGVLKRNGQINTWYDREIQPGTVWEKELDTHLESADLILLLISSHFIASDYCWGKEMQRALEKHRTGTAYVLPILLRPVYLKGTPVAALKALPSEAKPVTQWTDRDLAFEDITENISQVVNILQQKAKEAHLKKEKLKKEMETLRLQQRQESDQISILENTIDKARKDFEKLKVQSDEITRQIENTRQQINTLEAELKEAKANQTNISTQYKLTSQAYTELTGEFPPLLSSN